MRATAVIFGAGSVGRGFLGQLFSESGYDLRELMVGLTQTDAFLYRTAYANEGGE